jgi:hypothetical protein
MHLRTAKEIIRHLITKTGLAPFHVRVRKLFGQNVGHLIMRTVPERFEAIYTNRVWLNGRAEGTLSGLGSELTTTTQIRQSLPELLRSINANTLLDIGCGDFNWMREIELPCSYVGIDVVGALITGNNARYGNKRTAFILRDAVEGILPSADAALCREVLFHLSFSDIARLVANVRNSGITFLIATTDDDLQFNSDIITGDFRRLNLSKRPFCFPAPVRMIKDGGVVNNRTLSVWRLADLPLPQRATTP